MRNKEIKFVIHGDPIAKMRARLRKGFNNRFYDAQSHLKLRYQLAVKNLFNGQEMFDGPIQINADFYIKSSRTHNVPEGTYHYFKPDTDNLCKWLLDAIQDVCFLKGNDCIVSVLNARKLYAPESRTEVTIKELEYENIKKERS